jgi:hypothetical protein
MHDPRPKSRSSPGIINAMRGIGLGMTSPTTPSRGIINNALRNAGLERQPANTLAQFASMSEDDGVGLLGRSPAANTLGLLGSMPHVGNAMSAGLGFVPATPPPARNNLLGMYGLGEFALKSNPSTLADEVTCHCWEDQNGHYNIGDWIEKAARDVGR